MIQKIMKEKGLKVKMLVTVVEYMLSISWCHSLRGEVPLYAEWIREVVKLKARKVEKSVFYKWLLLENLNDGMIKTTKISRILGLEYAGAERKIKSKWVLCMLFVKI
jgi:hypothetical protein